MQVFVLAASLGYSRSLNAVLVEHALSVVERVPTNAEHCFELS